MTAEVVSASIAAVPAGEVPVMLRPWIKATVPLELYPSRFVGRDYVGADCLLTPAGDAAAPDSQPVLSVLPSDYLTSNAAYLEDLAAYAVVQGHTPEEGAAFARWVISSEILTFGMYDSAYEQWVRSLTCTMTARYAVLTYSRMNGAALRLECGCGQRHHGRPWEGSTVWNDEGCHYPSSSAVPLDRVADLITARGYQVAGEWSHGDVVRRVTVEPTARPARRRRPWPQWTPRCRAAPRPRARADRHHRPAGARADRRRPRGPSRRPVGGRGGSLAQERADAGRGSDRERVGRDRHSQHHAGHLRAGGHGDRSVPGTHRHPGVHRPVRVGRSPLLEVRLAAQRPPRRRLPRSARVGARRTRHQPGGREGRPDRVGTRRGRVAPPAHRRLSPRLPSWQPKPGWNTAR